MADRRSRNDRVIRFRDGGRDLVIYRYGTGADDLPLFPGSRIEVAKNQFIAFVRDGELLDTWDAGEYLLGYEMFPALAEKGLIQFRPYRPVDAQLYFLNLNRISDLKWATRTPALKEQGGKMTFAAVKDEIRQALIGEKQQAAYQSRINQLKILFPVDKM